MTRIRTDFLDGTISTPGITAAATSFSSPRLARLPAVSGGDTATITFFDTVSREYEIVHVTGHTASATTATITRAVEGSTSRAWATDARWVHGSTAAEWASVASVVVNAKEYGVKGDGTTDDTAALNTLLAGAGAGKTVLLPGGTYKLSGDVVVGTSGTSIVGHGNGTYLDVANGGLVFNGAAAYLTEINLENLSLRRTGTAGAALRLKGAGGATGVAHFNAANVRVRSSTGEGLLVDGSYIGTFTGCYFMGCATGIKVANDSVLGNVSGNNLSFLGGETGSCTVAANISSSLGVNFYGHAFEGSTTSGVELPAGAYGAGFYGCYFELNVGWDIKIGTTTPCFGVVIKGCTFFDSTANKSYAIQVIRARAVAIEDNTFNSYVGTNPVKILESGAGQVEGHARNGWDSTGGVEAGTELNGATRFNKTFPGYPGSAGISQHLTGSAVLTFTSIPANTTSDLTITVTGAAVGDDATCHSIGLEAGLTAWASVTAANTVTLRLANVTTAAITPPARTWKVRVWR